MLICVMNFFPQAEKIFQPVYFTYISTNPIEQTNLGNDVLGFTNADASDVYGAEIEARKNLGFIKEGFLSNMTIYTNAAIMKSSVQFDGITSKNPMQGQSPYLVNAGLGYSTENNSLSFNILYMLSVPA